jgi:MEMO1 family protein
MSLRRRRLPPGWYPSDPESVQGLVRSWIETGPGAKTGVASAGAALAAIAPHAGWAFSGRLAALAAASLAPARFSTLVIVGGHLPAGARPLAAGESAYDSPFGPVEADLELLQALESRLQAGGKAVTGRDEAADNTVEVLLPIIAVLYPGVRLLWLRAPNDSTSIELGQALQAASASLGRTVACLGSTDLTHYGPNYGFSPMGRGAEAEIWVRERNDRDFIDALLAMDGPEALRRAESEHSACSPGAAVAALSFASSSGASRAALLDYSTSLEVRRDDSFVGYAAIAFYKESL